MSGSLRTTTNFDGILKQKMALRTSALQNLKQPAYSRLLHGINLTNSTSADIYNIAVTQI